ncbi:hypothetical protein KQX54_019178 [Cotesia glomerata]|uniref:Secreted protein n=1 Tax=Cotesia glomerata TaxID=32391 RepID=A0AAV7IH79_COTGL|nr:hypothetical protein KQX54_019178 [Cotesia glomerata]
MCILRLLMLRPAYHQHHCVSLSSLLASLYLTQRRQTTTGQPQRSNTCITAHTPRLQAEHSPAPVIFFGNIVLKGIVHARRLKLVCIRRSGFRSLWLFREAYSPTRAYANTSREYVKFN